jgi:hypothetical protein
MKKKNRTTSKSHYELTVSASNDTGPSLQQDGVSESGTCEEPKSSLAATVKSSIWAGFPKTPSHHWHHLEKSSIITQLIMQ